MLVKFPVLNTNWPLERAVVALASLVESASRIAAKKVLIVEIPVAVLQPGGAPDGLPRAFHDTAVCAARALIAWS